MRRLLIGMSIALAACAGDRKPATPPAPLIGDELSVSPLVYDGYGVSVMAALNNDQGMVASIYGDSSAYVRPDSTVRGGTAIARYLTEAFRVNGLRSFERSRLGFRRIDDSTLIDSGRYVAIRTRPGADSLMEQGTFKTLWRARRSPRPWLILIDSIQPAAKPTR